jgi:hypothetical protein
MASYTPYIIRGCLIVLGGISYRVIKVFRRLPDGHTGWRIVHDGQLECAHPEPQIARVLKKGTRRYLLLCHTRLQHGHCGTITAFAEVRRDGNPGGIDRWLRVSLSFPRVPSAAYADRVAVVWQRRAPRKSPAPYRRSNEPLEPIPTEEIIFGSESKEGQ